MSLPTWFLPTMKNSLTKIQVWAKAKDLVFEDEAEYMIVGFGFMAVREKIVEEAKDLIFVVAVTGLNAIDTALAEKAKSINTGIMLKGFGKAHPPNIPPHRCAKTILEKRQEWADKHSQLKGL